MQYNIDVLTRNEAFSRGVKKYFTGVKCKNGHLAQRVTKTSACVDCLKKYRKDIERRMTNQIIKSAVGNTKLSIDIFSIDENLIKRILFFIEESRRNPKWNDHLGILDNYVKSLSQARDLTKEYD